MGSRVTVIKRRGVRVGDGKESGGDTLLFKSYYEIHLANWK